MKEVITHPKFGEVVVSRTRRARRISVSIRPPGKVRLSIPASSSVRSGMRFLAEKEGWIEATLERMSEKYPPRIIAPPYSTMHRELVLVPTPGGQLKARVTRSQIKVSHPDYMAPDDPDLQSVIRKGIIAALKVEAKEILPPMVEEFASRHGFRHGKVTVRATSTRWGSCSGRDDISLSVFLLCIPSHLAEYVILHELCHTRHKDHSAQFHKLLDEVTGGKDKELSRELRSWRPDIL